MNLVNVTVEVERILAIENLSSLREDFLVLVCWKMNGEAFAEGIAIWTLNEDGSFDCGDWPQSTKVENLNDHDQADGWL